MIKIAIFLFLFTSYVVYSAFVYSAGTESTIRISAAEKKHIDEGKRLYEKYNCTACHQLYGLGGYLGPELTTAYSDPQRGEAFMKTFLQAGGPRMPNFRFTDQEITDIIHFLKYVDTTAVSYKKIDLHDN